MEGGMFEATMPPLNAGRQAAARVWIVPQAVYAGRT